MKILKIVLSVVFFALFLGLTVISKLFDGTKASMLQMASILSALVGFLLVIPTKKYEIPNQKGGIGKRTVLSLISVLVLIPTTIFCGMYFFQDKKFYIISVLVILEILLPFFIRFEGRKHQARELVIISVISALAIAGRIAFFFLPQFKPVIAILIITGVCFGGEVGFLVGAVVGFLSNFYFGQWAGTPWQMFAFGIIGFIAGVLADSGLLKKRRIPLSIFGFFATLVVYGLIMNTSSVVLWIDKITFEALASSIIMGLPFDLVHAVSTVFFLMICADQIIEKLERIKTKYGI